MEKECQSNYYLIISVRNFLGGNKSHKETIKDKDNKKTMPR